jgi:hypothetical protein
MDFLPEIRRLVLNERCDGYQCTAPKCPFPKLVHSTPAPSVLLDQFYTTWFPQTCCISSIVRQLAFLWMSLLCQGNVWLQSP